ncbi:MAG: murein L,D-transpeptidase [Hyphomicrobium sp.]|nr:murein L,D-transpeptidase [Hyphomicrobium sp.]
MVQANTPQKRRRTGLTGLIMLALFLVGAAAIALMPTPVRDDYMISLQRHYRVWLSSTGQSIPGTPDLTRLDERLREKGMALGTPILMRAFKREFELEMWMLKDGRYELFATYPICKWSGRLGPKLHTGDRQSPEGFYTVDKTALNPNSRWHRSFNLGFPNAYDRSHGRTGSFLMVHGGCGSIGCYAMTNPVIDEIWAIVTRALDGGQQRFQVQVYPFRMTDENLARYRGERWSQFWADLKTGYDHFEHDRLPPSVSACDKRYTFTSGAKTGDLNGPVIAQCAASKSAASLN